MKKLLIIPFATLINTANALPNCPGNESKVYDMCFGTRNYSNGDKYTGDFKSNLPHGFGISINTDGSKYSGYWKDGNSHGQGTFTYQDGGVYIGEHKDGLENGHGKYTFADDGTYVGDHKDGIEHGRGTYTSPSGERWTGIWEKGNRVKEEISSPKNRTAIIKENKKNDSEFITLKKINWTLSISEMVSTLRNQGYNCKAESTWFKGYSCNNSKHEIQIDKNNVEVKFNCEVFNTCKLSLKEATQFFKDNLPIPQLSYEHIPNPFAPAFPFKKYVGRGSGGQIFSVWSDGEISLKEGNINSLKPSL